MTKCRGKNDDSIKLTTDDDGSSQVIQNMTREETMMEPPSGCFNFRFQGAFDLENQKDRLWSSMIILTADKTETGETGYLHEDKEKPSMEETMKPLSQAWWDHVSSWQVVAHDLIISLLIFPHRMSSDFDVCLLKGIVLTLFSIPLVHPCPILCPCPSTLHLYLIQAPFDSQDRTGFLHSLPLYFFVVCPRNGGIGESGTRTGF